MKLEALRDNNNFLKKNLVENTYNRYLVGLDSKDHEFISVFVNPPAIIDKNIFNLNYSRDGGETFNEESNQLIYGSYFFLGENVDEYSYEAVNIISLLSDFGGFIEIFYIAFSIIPLYYNT